MATLTLPTIHLNGSSVDSLIEQIETAGHALMAAHGALVLAAPNARDYYVQGPDAFDKAVQEHEARLAKVKAVYKETSAIYEYLQTQQMERQKRHGR